MKDGGKVCDTCVYGHAYELDRPCIVYRDDCLLYQEKGDDMPHSLRVRLKNLQRKGELTDKDIDRIFKALEQEPRGEMLICPECGLDVHSDFKTCPRCGAKMAESEEV